MTKGKCPSCSALVTQVQFDSVNVTPGLLGQGGWKGVSYLCPHCRVVLGVGIDPVALKTDTVSEVCDHLDKVTAELNSMLVQIANFLNRRG
jgi:hypothetical protein